MLYRNALTMRPGLKNKQALVRREQVALLRPDGSQAIDEHREWPAPPGPLRVLLIYSAPRTMRAAKLTYWDQALTPQASKLENTGPALRPPRRESEP